MPKMFKKKKHTDFLERFISRPRPTTPEPTPPGSEPHYDYDARIDRIGVIKNLDANPVQKEHLLRMFIKEEVALLIKMKLPATSQALKIAQSALATTYRQEVRIPVFNLDRAVAAPQRLLPPELPSTEPAPEHKEQKEEAVSFRRG